MLVEVLVVKDGLHRVPDELDFGTLFSASETRSLPVSLLNAGPSVLKVSRLEIKGSHAPSGSVELKEVTASPNRLTIVGAAVISGSQPGEHAGVITVRTDGPRIEVPFKARIIHGSLGYHRPNATFRCGTDEETVDHRLVFANKFSLPILLYYADIPHPDFRLLDFKPGVVLPGQSWPVTVRFLSASKPSLAYTTHLNFASNVSTLAVPLTVYHAKLDLAINSNTSVTSLAFGLLGLRETRTLLLNLTNHNPIPVIISQISFDFDELDIKLDSIRNGAGFAVSAGSSGWRKKDEVAALEAGSSALFSVRLAPRREAETTGHITLTTNYERRSIPVSWHALAGSINLQPSPFVIEGGFPGVVREQELRLISEYSVPVTITEVTFTDSRLSAKLLAQPVKVGPGVPTAVAVVSLDAGLPSQTQLPGTLEQEHLDKRAADVRHWAQLEANGENLIRSNLILRSDVNPNLLLPLRAILMPPALLNFTTLAFPLTYVGQTASQNLTIFNPTQVPIAARLRSSPSFLPPEPHAGLFSLPPESLEARVIPPGFAVTFGPISFTPRGSDAASVRLFVQNNLTGVEEFSLTGIGALALVGVDGSDTGVYLQLDLPDIKLSHCHSSYSHVHRFHLCNLGRLPLSSSLVVIGSSVSLAETEVTELLPGKCLPLRLTLQPDFSLTRLEASILLPSYDVYVPIQLDLSPALLGHCIEHSYGPAVVIVIVTICLAAGLRPSRPRLQPTLKRPSPLPPIEELMKPLMDPLDDPLTRVTDSEKASLATLNRLQPAKPLEARKKAPRPPPKARPDDKYKNQPLSSASDTSQPSANDSMQPASDTAQPSLGLSDNSQPPSDTSSISDSDSDTKEFRPAPVVDIGVESKRQPIPSPIPSSVPSSLNTAAAEFVPSHLRAPSERASQPSSREHKPPERRVDPPPRAQPSPPPVAPKTVLDDVFALRREAAWKPQETFPRSLPDFPVHPTPKPQAPASPGWLRRFSRTVGAPAPAPAPAPALVMPPVQPPQVEVWNDRSLPSFFGPSLLADEILEPELSAPAGPGALAPLGDDLFVRPTKRSLWDQHTPSPTPGPAQVLFSSWGTPVLVPPSPSSYSLFSDPTSPSRDPHDDDGLGVGLAALRNEDDDVVIPTGRAATSGAIRPPSRQPPS